MNRLALLQARAKLYGDIRRYFAEAHVLELDVPVLGASSVTDPHLNAISTHVFEREYYLQTSPEFFLKRLLSEGVGDCYYLGKAFRDDESGRRHNPEFTLLEWYRLGMDDRQLMDDVAALLQILSPHEKVQRLSYRQVFETHLDVNPHTASAQDLQALARQKLNIDWEDESKSHWLDLLFSHVVEPELNDGITFIFDYPACQCALAKLADDGNGESVARRFEVFWNGMELANGYWELVDVKEQQARFEADNLQRKAMNLPTIAIDQPFVAALEKGLPACAGVALGVDRLLMCLTHTERIESTLAFPFNHL